MSTLSMRAAGFGQAISSQSITDLSSATGLTVPAAAKSAVVTALSNNVAYRVDGTSPTAGVGHIIAANGSGELFGDDLDNVEFIEVTASASIFVTYYGDK